MIKKECYEIFQDEYELIVIHLSNIRRYLEADGAESPDLLKNALEGIEVIFDEV